MKKKVLVFVLGAFDDKVDGALTNYCKLELFAKNEKEAIERAKKFVKRNQYESTSVVEINDK